MPLRFCISLLDVTVPTDTEYRDKSLKSQSYKRDSLTNFLFFPLLPLTLRTAEIIINLK